MSWMPLYECRMGAEYLGGSDCGRGSFRVPGGLWNCHLVPDVNYSSSHRCTAYLLLRVDETWSWKARTFARKHRNQHLIPNPRDPFLYEISSHSFSTSNPQGYRATSLPFETETAARMRCQVLTRPGGAETSLNPKAGGVAS